MIKQKVTRRGKHNPTKVPRFLSSPDPVFSKLNSLRFAFVAHFDEAAGELFEEIFRVRQEIIACARILVDTPSSEDEYEKWFHMNEPLLSTLGWGPAVQNQDKLRLRIDEAVDDIETICRPELAQKAGEEHLG
jgi:hypothetical protein